MLISLTLTPPPKQAVQLVLSLLRQLSADSAALQPGLSADWLAEHLPALPYAEAVTRRAATCSRKVGAHPNPSPSPNPNQASACPRQAVATRTPTPTPKS